MKGARRALRLSGPLALAAGLACGGAAGLRPTPPGSGPVVVFDWEADPLPELPFPNDLATRPDPSSPTGLRLNFSEEGTTEREASARRKINELSGFGIYAPISVRFDAPLDLDTLVGRHRDDGDFLDDAVFLIDISPESPDFLQPVRLDFDHGRFPQELEEPDRYFPNDTRATSPSLLFEMVDEDLDGDGVLDPGEDTDGDGVLDRPNVRPGAVEPIDPYDDLMSFYERQTDTLIMRVVQPLRERTRYAVVLTNRLHGLDGAPVRSPFPWINHSRQTQALGALELALPPLGLSLDEVGFAWSFTTGDITGDLERVREGLYGRGPFAELNAYQPVLTGVPELHAIDGEPNTARLPIDRLINLLVLTDLVPQTVVESYDWADAVVSASFESPNLLADFDDRLEPGRRPENYDESDEWWHLDPATGFVHHAPNRVVFDCVLPAPDAAHQQPYPVALLGHGYGSNRFEMMYFAGQIARFGVATCAIDNPGHGIEASADELEEFGPLIEGAGLGPLIDHLLDNRAVDLDNDGNPDSGEDQWVADAFHTRDMVRQGALDWFQLVRVLRGCGTGSMPWDADGDGQDELGCDWDGDGTADIGGPSVPLYMVGGSLGGILTAIAAPLEPEVTAAASIASGAGLTDIGVRSTVSGVPEAVFGRLISPLLLGFPEGEDSVRVALMVNAGRRMAQRDIGLLPLLPEGGSLVLENLDNGERREVPVPVDRASFRIPIAADALDAIDKRHLAGIPLDGPGEDEQFTVPDPTVLGDRLRLAVRDAAGNELSVIDSFDRDTVFEGVTHPAGSELVALSWGLGHYRGSPELRRIVTITAMMTEPGDPVAYAPLIHQRPAAHVARTTPMLFVQSPGDMVVPVNAGVALARAAGIIEMDEIDERYGSTVDRFMIDSRIVQGLEEYGFDPQQVPYRGVGNQPVLFDGDDLDNGSNEFGEPSAAPLRVTMDTGDGVVALRMPYSHPRGSHGFGAPDPERDFDIASFAINQIGRFFQLGGRELSDDPCLADASCDFLRPAP